LIVRAILFITTAILAAQCTAALAAEPCYEQQLVEASMNCATNSGNSADFASGCKAVEAHYENVEVECPATGRWVNVNAMLGEDTPRPSRSAVCKAAGMKIADINGYFCASGERRPNVGGDWESINYQYGRKGGGNGFTGGNDIDNVVNSYRDTDPYDRNRPTGPVHSIYSSMCYDGHANNRNNTGEDAVVAYYCQ
jgi:hypothetical protein